MRFPEPVFSTQAAQSLLPGSVPISVALIVRDEERHLADCLASVAFAADIVVVDALSSDRSAKIARAQGARVFLKRWAGYTQQRNYSLAQCRYDWVLRIDADERVSQRLAQAIADLMKAGPRFPAYKVPGLNEYFGRWLMHGGVYPDLHTRLFDRRQGSFVAGVADVHEDVHFERCGHLSGPVMHLAYPSFQLALRKLNRYTDLEAHGRAQRGQSSGLYGIFWRPFERFVKNYLFKRGFLDGMEGFLYSMLCALYQFVLHIKLRELARERAQELAKGAAKPALREGDLLFSK